MWRIYQMRSLAQHLLPVLALIAVLFAAPPAVSAQQTPSDQAAAPPSQSFLAKPGVQLTPEYIGDLRLVERRYQEAIESYQKAPHDSAAVWNKMGIAYQMLFDEKDAARCYKASLRIEPRNARALNNLGTIYDAQKNYEKAEGMYRQALKINPKSAVFTVNLGTNLMVQNDYSEGWELYQRAMTLNPEVFDSPEISVAWNTMTAQESGAINYYMAKSYAQTGMTDRAIGALRRAFNEGFAKSTQVSHDRSFRALHGNPGFEQLLAEHKEQSKH